MNIIQINELGIKFYAFVNIFVISTSLMIRQMRWNCCRHGLICGRDVDKGVPRKFFFMVFYLLLILTVRK